MLKHFEKISESTFKTSIEYTKAANDSLLQGIKSLMYLNGAATIGVMTFLGHHDINSIATYFYFALSILCFAFGTIMGVITYFQGYAYQLGVSRLYEILHVNSQSFANLPPTDTLITEHLKLEAFNQHKDIQQNLSDELDKNKTERNITNTRLKICQFSSLFLFCLGLGSSLGGIAYPFINYCSFFVLLTPPILLLIITVLFARHEKKKPKERHA